MNLIKLGVLLMLIGFASVFIVTLLSARNADFAGLVMIGPIPIAFGTSPEFTLVAMVMGLVIMIVLGLFLTVFWTIMRSVQAEHEYESAESEKKGTKIKSGG